MKLYYQFPGTWFGDCMPFGWDLATTKDFVDYRDCGVAVPRGGDDEQDQSTS